MVVGRGGESAAELCADVGDGAESTLLSLELCECAFEDGELVFETDPAVCEPCVEEGDSLALVFDLVVDGTVLLCEDS